MKINKEVVGLSVLLVVFIIAGMFVSSPNNDGSRTVGSELTADPSIYNDRASGSKAFYEWTAKLGYGRATETADWSHLPGTSQLLISIAPESIQGFDVFGAASGAESNGKLTDADARGVAKWLSSGRTLLLLSSRIPSSDDSSSGNASDSTSPTFGDILGVMVETAQYGKQMNFAPLQVSPLTAGVDSIQLSTGDNRVFRRQRDFVALFASILPAKGPLVRAEPAVIVLPEGKGRIIIVADDYFASNSNLAQADNAAFLSNIIQTSTSKRETVLFDEFHHSDVGASEGSVWSAMGRPLQAATVQLGLTLILIIGMIAPRFGSIKTLKKGEERTSGEYLTSLADLYRRADATIPALETIYRQFLRDVCQRLALPSDIPLDSLADIAAKRGKFKPEGLRQLIAACERALDTKILSAPDLLKLSRQMDTVKKQLD